MAVDEVRYHHGDLRNELIHVATSMIQDGGLPALSMRKLSDQLGVSRTALYHHFSNKNDLLAAIAERGFATLTEVLTGVMSKQGMTLVDRLECFTASYVQFALTHETEYELMFGHELWRSNPSSHLQRVAKNCFRRFARMIEGLHEDGVLAHDQDPLRLSQLIWAALHGLVKLSHDGIFARQEDLEDITRYAVAQVQGLLRV